MSAAGRSLADALHVLRPQARLRDQAGALAGRLNRDDRLLDVGCGTGYLSAYLQDMHGVQATGVDVTDFRRTPIPFQLFDGTSIPFPDRSFDHVVLSEVLHHSHDPVALVKECHRVAQRSIMCSRMYRKGPSASRSSISTSSCLRATTATHSARRASPSIGPRCRGWPTTLVALYALGGG